MTLSPNPNTWNLEQCSASAVWLWKLCGLRLIVMPFDLGTIEKIIGYQYYQFYVNLWMLTINSQVFAVLPITNNYNFRISETRRQLMVERIVYKVQGWLPATEGEDKEGVSGSLASKENILIVIFYQSCYVTNYLSDMPRRRRKCHVGKGNVSVGRLWVSVSKRKDEN